MALGTYGYKEALSSRKADMCVVVLNANPGRVARFEIWDGTSAPYIYLDEDAVKQLIADLSEGSED